jgi:hypothetical protein
MVPSLSKIYILTPTHLFSKKTISIENFCVNFYFNILDVNVEGGSSKNLLTLPMTPIVDAGKIRFVLYWPDGPIDLDLHSIFRVSRFSKCEVYFGKKECLGTELNTENSIGGKYGVEAITLNTLGNYVYTFAVNKYIDSSNGLAQGDNVVPGALDTVNLSNNTIKYNSLVKNYPISRSNARISVYVNGYKDAIYKLVVPQQSADTIIDNSSNTDPHNWWLAFCMNGKIGLNSLTPINKLSITKPNFSYCENIYEPKPSFAQISTTNKMRRRNI